MIHSEFRKLLIDSYIQLGGDTTSFKETSDVQKVIKYLLTEFEKLPNIAAELEQWLKSQRKPIMLGDECIGYDHYISCNEMLDKLKELSK